MTQTGGGVPDLRQLTSMEERTMELAGGDGPSRIITDSQVGVLHASEQKHTLNLDPPRNQGPCIYLVKNSGSFASPNYPNDYPNNADCTWYIRVDNQKRIGLNFTDLECCQTN
ncbi:suppressor of tumorigenicity 14 protein homolog [Mustelus asterias]